MTPARATGSLALGLALLGTLAGCSALPAPPPPLPDSFVPAVSASAATSYVSEDGFTLTEHTAYRVRVRTCDGWSTGTAFAIDAHTLVTNRHVVEGAALVTLTSYDGREMEVAEVQSDTEADLALLTVDEELDEWLELADEDPVFGDDVTVSGYPEGDVLTTVTGPYRNMAPEVFGTDPDEVLVIRVTAAPGSSGSAVVNAEDEVVGVLYAVDTEGLGWAYAVSLDSLTTMLDDPGVREPVAEICAS
ncbi:S1 family peptidase [Demequina zhanjiangensis]|uniref:Serine protease n=1 Tax=Demequina zhanjiangensis TaxID=3051659 RepID=A0ABT8G3Q2_9MICO|nr:serine protease [Demequina sp. SYSU T00b26]MDN4473697.1 serine protease [Demequina sp. SYSU T00b26]